MADTITQGYSFVKPDPGGSDETWGEKLNANWDSADSLLSGMAYVIENKVGNDRVLTDVPNNALFTDTVYTKPDSEEIAYINGLEALLSTLETKINLAEKLALAGI